MHRYAVARLACACAVVERRGGARAHARALQGGAKDCTAEGRYAVQASQGACAALVASPLTPSADETFSPLVWTCRN